MSNGLDGYLQAVAHELRGLEAEQRESELREMRGHLEAIVARLMEGGASEEEAVSAAIAQFGAARQVGKELEEASEAREPARRQVEAALCAALCYLIPSFLSARLISGAPAPTFDLGAWLIPGVLFVIAPFVSGFVAGRMAPRGGGRASLWLFGVVGLLCVLTHEDPERTVYASLLTVTLGLVWLGGRIGSRHAQRRTDAQRA